MKQSFCAVLSALMMVSAFCPVMAQAGPAVVGPTTPGDRNAVVELKTEALTFDVTVPTSLPIHVSASGEVTTADDVKIINNSHGAVTVSNVTLHSHGDWSAVDTETDLSDTPVGTKQYSMTINNETTTEAGAITFDQENWPSIYGANDSDTDELPIIYSAAVAPQADTVNTDVAEVVFTIGWDYSEPDVLTDYYTFTDDPATGGWKVELNSEFKNALYYKRGMGQPIGQKQYHAWLPGSPLPALPAEYEGKPVTNLASMFALTKIEHTDDGGIMMTPSYGVSFGNLDLSNFDISNVVNMEGIFYDCGADVIDLSSFDFSEIDIPNYFIDGVKTVYVKDAADQEKLQEKFSDITFEVKSVD